MSSMTMICRLLSLNLGGQTMSPVKGDKYLGVPLVMCNMIMDEVIEDKLYMSFVIP